VSHKIKNLPASIMDRIRNKARDSDLPFHWLLQNYVNERFLYRLSKSKHCQNFVLKGGLIFFGWNTPLRRHTKDIDFRAYTGNAVENIIQVIRDICTHPVESDGVDFDTNTITTENITEHADYPGIRVHLVAFIGDKTRVNMQIDIGFSDEISPSPTLITYPTLLEMPVPQLLGYSRETVIAEKLHSILFRGRSTSRFKDFYDIWFIAKTFDIMGGVMQEAISLTFQTRNFQVPIELPYVLSDEYSQENNTQTQWMAFLNTFHRLNGSVPSFFIIIQIIKKFVWPVLESITKGISFDSYWNSANEDWEK
jgi:predicted nucleotidyltransferase component of viral defense system